MLCNYINKIRYLNQTTKKICQGLWILSYVKYIVKNLSGKYGQEVVDKTKNLLQMHS